MIDGPPTWSHRVTKTCFRTCSTCQSRSQAPLCLCTLRLVSNQAEGTFVRLRYSLGGDRPSQTTRLAVSWIRMSDLS
jgi:DTW domain-containing protein YfiP